MQLEFINNEIWANVWMTECIAKIDPLSGKVRYVCYDSHAQAGCFVLQHGCLKFCSFICYGHEPMQPYNWVFVMQGLGVVHRPTESAAGPVSRSAFAN